MSWAKLDDGVYSHPKILRADLQAVGLYLLSIAYAARHETDGALPKEAVAMLARGDMSLADQLVELALYELHADGFRIRSFLNYNPSAREAQKLRNAAKLRMKRFRKRTSNVTESVRANEQRTNAFVPDGTGRDTLSVSSGVKRGSGGKGGKHPLPADYPLTDELRDDAMRLGCLDPARMHGAFVDYWRGTGKAMADWRATFRRWARNAHDGSPGKACGCQPRPGAKVATMDAVRSLAAKIAVREGMGR